MTSKPRHLAPTPVEKERSKRNISRWVPPKVDIASPRYSHGITLMRSHRWTGSEPAHHVRVRGQPFILPSGHISGSVYLTWKCSAQQWFATTVRSVIQRISKRSVVKRRCKYKTKRHLTMIAVLYTCTNDDGMLERLLHCKAKDFTRTFYHYLIRVDDKTRFLYDQAVSAALWFELRGNPRVQSTKRTILPQYRKMLPSYSTERERREETTRLSDPWIVQNRCFTKGMNFLAL